MVRAQRTVYGDFLRQGRLLVGAGLGDGRLVGRRRRGWHAALQEQAGEGEKEYGTDRDGEVKEHDRAFLKGDCRRGAVQVQ